MEVESDELELEVVYQVLRGQSEDEGDIEEILDPEDQNQTSVPKPLPGKKRSSVWSYYNESDDPKIAVCNICEAKLSRGGVGKNASTKPLRSHLRSKHPKQFQDMSSADASKASTSSSNMSQPMVTDSFRVQPRVTWDNKDSRAIQLHYLIGEMMATDNQPYCIVTDEGFKRVMNKAEPRYVMPGRNFFTNKIVPDIYNRCRAVVQSRLDNVKFLSFTSDIWTSNHSNEPFISFTAHFVNNDFKMEHFDLCASHFPGTHSGEAIAAKITRMLEEWNINKDQVHLLLRDGGPNMVKGANETNLANEGCFLHKLQLVIADAIDSQRMVHDMIAVSRKIVTHFNHSALACDKLKQIQTQLGMKTNKLIQDVSTRWNSTYYMLQSINDQKKSIVVFAAEEQGFQCLNQNQWSLLESTLSLLQPFEEITKIVSSSESCISEVIPYVRSLQMYLTKENDLHKGVGTMKEQLREGISERFKDIFNKHYFSVATAIDPRYKFTCISEENRDAVRETLMQKMSILSPKTNTVPDGPPPVKTPRQDTHSSFWDCLSELSGTLDPMNSTRDAVFKSEINLFTSLPAIDRKENPFIWWKTNQTIFPNLSNVAKVYMSAPASTVWSERLFSEAGNIYEDTRNRLLPKHGESLTFLHHNLKLLNYKY